nr:DAK2 domain-containing protein [Suicoccus acidiformans]
MNVKHTELTASDFKAMVIAGAENLAENVELVNALNVFPVPDGDTGTNMNMTFQSGKERLLQTQTDHVGELTTALAKGLLMGARGNSGVILSQIFRGFSKAVETYETLTSEQFMLAFIGGVDAAYKAVMKPVEGTILTVAREAGIQGEIKAKESDDIVEIMEAIVQGAQTSLDDTPNLLPVLKQVGVVDSGGKGLLCIYEGFLASLKGETVADVTQVQKTPDTAKHSHAVFNEANEHPLSMDEITYGYCTEIMVSIGLGEGQLKEFDYDDFRNLLDTKGDSLLVVADDEIIKVHIHTENPGEIMQLGQQYGELVKIKVDNMREQVRALEQEEATLQQQADPLMTEELCGIKLTNEPLKTAIVAVAAGDGIRDLFESIGVHVILEGGQTMNPATEDFVKAVEGINAESLIILPNNKNIQMAAEQVASIVDIPVEVIATRSIPEGVSAMLAFNETASFEENVAGMTDMSKEVTSGQVTYAIRDTEINDLVIKKDDFMGLIDGDIVVATNILEETLYQTLDAMVDEWSEIVTVYIGEDGSQETAEAALSRLSEKYDAIDTEIVEGNQPVYHYMMSVE